MPYVTAFEVQHPGKERVTKDVPVKRMGQRRMVNRNMEGLAGLPYKTVTDFSPMYGLGLDFASMVRDVAAATGLINPLSYYEPGLTPAQVWVKYDSDISDHANRLQTLGSATQKAALQAKLNPILAQRSGLAQVFQIGSVPGERDIERLGTMVYDFRQWRKAWEDAKKATGTRPTIGPLPAQLPGAKKANGLTWGIAALLAWKLFG